MQSQWLTNFVGALPQHGGTTAINAPIIPVTVQLLGQDGQVFLSSSATQYESDVADSPVFCPGTWPSSSTPTELPDAIQRAEFNQTAKADWHTELAPRQHPGHLPHHPARAHIHEQARAREKLHRQPRRLRRSRAPAASTASSTASHGNALASMPTEILSPRLPSSRSTR